MKNRNLPHKDDWATPPQFLKDWGFEDYFDLCPYKHDLSLWDRKAPDGVEHVRNSGMHDSMLVWF
jgi:hypothetical protein